MNFAKRLLAAGIVLIIAGVARGQVLKKVPADAFVIVKISNLDATSKKIADLAGMLGIAAIQPEFADPLASLEKSAQVSQGINKAGDMAFVVGDPEKGTPDKHALMLVPVSDYKAFLGNWADAKTEGEMTSVIIQGETHWIANWGEYAAISPDREMLAQKPAGIALSAAASKDFDAKDFAVYINLKVIRPKALSGLDDLQKQADAGLDQVIAMAPKTPQMDLAKMGPLLKVIVRDGLKVARACVQETDAVTYSAKLSHDGIGLSELVEFQPGSNIGNRVSQFKNTDAPLLNGLPEAKYLIFGGQHVDSKANTDFIASILDPFVKDTADLDQGKSIADAAAAVKSSSAANTDAVFGILAPSGQLGQDPLIQYIAIKTGDAKAMADSKKNLADAYHEMAKSLGMDPNNQMYGFQPAAKTLDGVAFDEYLQNVGGNGQTIQEQQAQQVMKFVYGKDGFTLFSGIVNDKTLLDVSGIPDATVSTVIASIKAGDSPMAKTEAVKLVAAQLPSQRIAVAYFPLAELVRSGLNYAKMFAMDMPVNIPEDLEPIGMTVATEGSAIRIDGYIPSKLMEAMTSAGIQIYMEANRDKRGGPNGL